MEKEQEDLPGCGNKQGGWNVHDLRISERGDVRGTWVTEAQKPTYGMVLFLTE